MVVRGMLETLPAYREGFAKAGGNFHLVVLSSMAMGAASAAEAAGVPRLTLHMQPALFRSIYECPVFLQELSWLARSPCWVKSLFFHLVDGLLWEKARKGLNAFRKSLDLPPFRNFYAEAFHGTEGVAALFPDWYAAPQPDWPANVRQFGFPVAVGQPRPLPANLENFLNRASRRWLGPMAPPILIFSIFNPELSPFRRSLNFAVCSSAWIPRADCSPWARFTLRTPGSRTFFPGAVPSFIMAESEPPRNALPRECRSSSSHAPMTNPIMPAG